MCDLGNQNKCAICPNLIGSKCATKDAIYLVICDLCTKSYLGDLDFLNDSDGQFIRCFIVSDLITDMV